MPKTTDISKKSPKITDTPSGSISSEFLRLCEQTSADRTMKFIRTKFAKHLHKKSPKDNALILSNLPKTWLIDLDGTILKHNGYLIDGKDTLLKGVKEFFASLPSGDSIILLTARKEADLPPLREFLAKEGIKFSQIIGDLPFGERILINDTKPSGLKTAYAINKKRDKALKIEVKIDENL